MPKKRYAIVGTGSRSGMYVRATSQTYSDTADLVAFCDLSQTRMDWYNKMLAEQGRTEPVPTYLAADFDRMVAEQKPDTVIVTTMDSQHHKYIVRAMELGCDVISEKPMTTDVDKMKAIFDAIDRTGKNLRVTFNYRYSPAYTQFRKLVMDGVIGRPLAVDFSWILNTSHGADYFRRWHSEKQNSGGLLVHKATHHFDLVNFWIDSYPKQVFAMGDLQFYGQKAANGRGEHYDYRRYTGVPEAKDDPFALFLDERADYKGLYLDAEAETGYIRDRNVFNDTVNIEDTMNVTARYRNGVLLSYCLIAYAPWEGLRVAITGDKGRIELDVVESVTHLQSDKQRKAASTDSASASKGSFKTVEMRAYPMFGESYIVEIPPATGGHGGADPVMLEQIFSDNPPYDPFQRGASHIDGAASILTGICANESIRTGRLINVDDMFKLPEKASVEAVGK